MIGTDLDMSLSGLLMEEGGRYSGLEGLEVFNGIAHHALCPKEATERQDPMEKGFAMHFLSWGGLGFWNHIHPTPKMAEAKEF